MFIILENVYHSKHPTAFAIYNFNLHFPYGKEWVQTAMFTSTGQKILGFFQWVKVIFHTGPVHNK